MFGIAVQAVCPASCDHFKVFKRSKPLVCSDVAAPGTGALHYRGEKRKLNKSLPPKIQITAANAI